MALSLVLTSTAVNAQANILGSLANSGYLYLKTAASSICATLIFAAAAFGAAVDGVITAAAISAVTITASGTVDRYSVTKSDQSTVLWTGTAGTTASFNLTLNADALVAGATMTVTSLIHTVVKQ